ncbi:hypothetical protein P7C70_g694, partial [Phenoliferia sp. Uapishka_3]
MSSASSSRSASPDPTPFSETEAANRLAQLEKLLQSSLGYSNYQPQEDEADQPPPKKRKKGKAVVVDEQETDQAPEMEVEVDQDEVVAFRLFSTQKTPQAVVIREKEGWDAVKDPRIRDATEESKAVLEKRASDIASTTIDGAQLLLNASLEPLSRHANRSTPRTLTSLSPLPTLAYLNAFVPPPPTSTPSTASSSKKLKISHADKPKLLRKGAIPPRQTVRRPIVLDGKLELVSLVKDGKGMGKEKKKRLSKSRRVGLAKRRVGNVVVVGVGKK